MNKSRGGRYVLWGARRRDIQIGGLVDRRRQKRGRRVLTWPETKRGKQIGW